MIDVINELRAIKGSKAKIEYLNKFHDNDLLRLVLRMTYDKVNFTWGMTLKQILNAPHHHLDNMELISAIAWMTNSLGTTRGKIALEAMHSIISSVSDAEADIIKGIINRDLKLGMNVKSLNKAIPGLIHEVSYMRCDVFGPKHSVKYPAFLQIKMDGTYREAQVEDGTVTMWTRQGHKYHNPTLERLFANLKDGRYIGELIIPGMSRVQANGCINSDDPPFDDIKFVVWDYISEDPNIAYRERLQTLREILSVVNTTNVELIHTETVNSDEDALRLTKQWMQAGEEGSVLKDFSMPFKNGTSKLQLKIKHVIELDVRVTGFTEGKLGTSREGKVGAIEFKTDDGMICGQTSGFTKELLDELTKNPDKFVDKIMTVQCNDLQLAEESSTYKLMHPRFVEFRDDKTETDDIERAKQLLELSYMS